LPQDIATEAGFNHWLTSLIETSS